MKKTIINNKPLVFISYAGEEIDLADFVKKILLRVLENTTEVFIAKRDIASGEDSLKTMLTEKLLKAEAIIPICSYKSKKTQWLWWESASVWAKTGNVHPLFTNISPNKFGPPLTLFVQGKEYFIEEDFFDTIKTLCENLKISTTRSQLEFTDKEVENYAELKKAHSEHIPPAHINIA